MLDFVLGDGIHPRKSFMELLNTKNRYCTGNHMYYEYFERDSGRNLKNKQDENLSTCEPPKM